MGRQKIALNKFETLLRAGALSAKEISRVPGAASLDRRMKALGGQNVRDAAQTRLLRKLRQASYTDQRPLTARQLRMEAGFGDILSKFEGTRARRTVRPIAGHYMPAIAPVKQRTQTPISEKTEELKKILGGRAPHQPYAADQSSGKIYYDPDVMWSRIPEYPLKNYPGPRRKRRSILRATLVHEGAEKELLQQGLSLGQKLRSADTPAAAELLHRQKGLIPLSTHYDPGVLLREYGAHAGMGWGVKRPGGGTSLADHNTFHVVPLDPSEKALQKIMRNVRATPTGDFPVGGRHEQAVRKALVRELLAHPKKYRADLQSAFDIGRAGARLHPDLERYLVLNARRYY